MTGNLQKPYLEVKDYQGQGFSPLVSFSGWLVAKMNWEERFDPTHLSVLERHNGTDEVFILIRGKAALLIKTEAGIEAREMETGVFYNVKQGVWHNVLGSKDVSWIIVETHDPHGEPTQFHQLQDGEKGAVRQALPDWF